MGTKRILVLYADAGFGHRSAAKALVAAAQQERGEECEVLLSNPLDSPLTPAWLRDVQTDYDHIATRMPQLLKLGFDLSDTAALSLLVENALRVLLFRSLRAILRETRPDVIISTYPLYQAPLGSVFSLEGCAVPLVCVVTDLVTIHSMWFSPDSVLTVVPTPEARSLGLSAGIDPGRIEIIGIPVHPRIASERRGQEELRAGLGWEPGRATFLAVGSRRVKGLPECLDALNHSGYPLQIAASAGRDETLFAKLKAIDWHVPVRLYEYIEDMPAMLRAADAVITKAGGLIVTESLAAGRPLILVDVLPGQEVGNAEHVVRGGAGERAKNPLECLRIASHWLIDGGRVLAERAESARKLGRPGAASEIIARALALASEGPCDYAPRQPLTRLKELFRRFGETWED